MLDQENVPVIDLSQEDSSAVIAEIARACSTFGFFQVVNHGIDPLVMKDLRRVSMDYFCSEGLVVRRTEHNARGYFDDELTKQKRDWKRALDVGVPGSRNWALQDEDPQNTCLDGFNRFPDGNQEFRKVVVDYFTQCEALSDRLARLMAQGVDVDHSDVVTGGADIVEELKTHHTSYVRLNYYPICDKENEFGISPHRDAGFLTVLLQDDNCHSLQVWFEDAWHTVVPVPGALTINTGDMAQIWSNGRYLAPLHRVLTHATTPRFSAPFFYNPPYNTYVRPYTEGTTTSAATNHYHPCLWGYFRALRFAGDMTDLGVEIQVEDYHVDSSSKHLARQKWIAAHLRWDEPFSVENLRRMLVAEEEQRGT